MGGILTDGVGVDGMAASLQFSHTRLMGLAPCLA